jgi:hypothetical protein
MGKVRALAVGLACAAATQAVAFGAGPSPGIAQGLAGIARGDVRYVASSSGGYTVVEAVRRNGGRVLRSRSLNGTWGIALVAFDGTTGGLSSDGRTLILADGTGVSPEKKRSLFLKLDTKRFRVLQTVKLKGSFSFDALSPNGRYLYLIEHLWSYESSPRYRVRAYDLRAERLLARVISDKTSWETDMAGFPVSRLTHGGWAYTLYGATGPRPFIHALDLTNAVAMCIDMPWKFQPKKVFEFRLRRDGDGHLVVSGPRGRALAVVDMQDKRVLSFVRNP